MARLLVPEDFGLIAMSMAVTGFASLFMDLGLSSATVQRQKLDQDTVSGLLVVGVAMGFVVMGLAFALAPFAAYMFDDTRVTAIVMVTAGTLPIGAMSTQHLALMNRRMEFFKLQMMTIFSLSLSTIVALGLAWQTEIGYWALVVSNWINTILLGVLAWTLSPWRPSRVKSWQGVKESINFGVYLTGFSFVEYFHRQTDNLLVGWKFGAEPLGFYTRAYGLFFLPTTALIYPFFEVAKPVLSRAQTDPEEYRLLFHRMLFPLNLMTCVLAGVLYITAPFVIILLYGDQWQQSIPLFKALSVCMVVQAIVVSLGWIYISTGRTRAMFYSQLLMTTAFAVCFLIAVQISLYAVAVAYSAVSVVLTLPLIWLAVRNSPFKFTEFVSVHVPLPFAAGLTIFGIQVIAGEASGGLVDYVLQSSLFVSVFLLLVGLSAVLLPAFRLVVADLLRDLRTYLVEK